VSILKNTKKGRVLIVCLSVLLIFVILFGVIFGIYSCNFSSYNWTVSQIKKHYYYDIPEIEGCDGDPNLVVSKYLDKYSAFYTKEQYTSVESSNAGSKSGVGITSGYVEGKGLYIRRVVGNSPAYISGLRAGEYISSVTFSGAGSVSFNIDSVTAATQYLYYLSGVSDDTTITLNGESASYSMQKSDYTASYAYLATNSTSWHFEDAASGGLAAVEDITQKIDYLPDGMGYINLSQFYGTAASEFYVLVQKFNALNCSSLILDLRSNGGGYVDTMCNIAGVFAGGERKTSMIYKDKYGSTSKFYCRQVTDQNTRISSDVKVYVLANSGTASASEALIGALVCYGALDLKNIFLSDYSDEFLDWYYGGVNVKNARTYGKGIMQTTYQNSLTGVAIKLTTAKIFWPDGETCIHDDEDGLGGGLNTSMGCRTIKTNWEFTLGDTELQSAVATIKAEI
jgi:C-terminal processing protease CtpA/Prc